MDLLTSQAMSSLAKHWRKYAALVYQIHPWIDLKCLCRPCPLNAEETYVRHEVVSSSVGLRNAEWAGGEGVPNIKLGRLCLCPEQLHHEVHPEL